MKIRLKFEGRAKDLRLIQMALWVNSREESPKPDIELFGVANSSPKSVTSHLFQWRSSVRAFCILLLEAFLGGKPFRASLEDGKASMARSLTELLGDKQKKDGEPTWVQTLFAPFIRINSINPRVPTVLFNCTSNSNANHFEVSLGTEWENSLIEIHNEKGKVEDKDTVNQINCWIKEQYEKSVSKPRLSRLTANIELLAYDTRIGQLKSMEDAGLPLAADAGIAIRVHFERLAYAYVFWINSSGRVQPLFPWKNQDWSSKTRPSTLNKLSLPDIHLSEVGGFYPLESQPGIETVILLGCDSPPPMRVIKEMQSGLTDLAARFRPTLPDSSKIYYVSDSRLQRTNRPATRLGKPHAFACPLSELTEAILHLVGHAFPCIAGCSFATKGHSGF
jgi:hypothetical protein